VALHPVRLRKEPQGFGIEGLDPQDCVATLPAVLVLLQLVAHERELPRTGRVGSIEFAGLGEVRLRLLVAALLVHELAQLHQAGDMGGVQFDRAGQAARRLLRIAGLQVLLGKEVQHFRVRS